MSDWPAVRLTVSRAKPALDGHERLEARIAAHRLGEEPGPPLVLDLAGTCRVALLEDGAVGSITVDLEARGAGLLASAINVTERRAQGAPV